MKKILLSLLVLSVLTGCRNRDNSLEQGLALREKMLQSGCSFLAEITADYGDRTFSFQMLCNADMEGNLAFTVQKPESISGITGTVSAAGGKLTFENTVLAFSMVADGEISPVTSPWILTRTLQSGYVVSSVRESEGIHLTIHDSYEEDALLLDIWLDGNELPRYAEILWQGRRILSIKVDNFAFV